MHEINQKPEVNSNRMPAAAGRDIGKWWAARTIDGGTTTYLNVGEVRRIVDSVRGFCTVWHEHEGFSSVIDNAGLAAVCDSLERASRDGDDIAHLRAIRSTLDSLAMLTGRLVIAEEGDNIEKQLLRYAELLGSLADHAEAVVAASPSQGADRVFAAFAVDWRRACREAVATIPMKEMAS